MPGLTHDYIPAHQSLGSFTSNPTSVSNTASGRASAVVTGLYETSVGLSRAIPTIEKFADPNLSDEGLAEARAGLQLALKSAVRERVEHLTTHLDDAVRAAEAAAAPYRPVLDAESVAQLTRTDQAWNNSIRPQLEAGKNWDDIIPTLDVDALLAVQRFAPTHEAGKRTRFDQNEVPSVLAGVQRMIESRLADAVPSEEGRAALREAREVSKFAETATANMRTLLSVDGPNDLISATLSVKRATFDVGAQSVPDTTVA